MHHPLPFNFYDNETRDEPGVEARASKSTT